MHQIGNEGLRIIPGTRLLSSSDLVGSKFSDPKNPHRVWDINNELYPTEERSGRRLRISDQRGFVSFITEADYLLLSGQAKPGNLNSWSGEEFGDIGDYRRGWTGLRASFEDLEDDLYLREADLRTQHARYFYQCVGRWPIEQERVLAGPFHIQRLVHRSNTVDELHHDLFLRDAHPITGEYPDTSFENLKYRWVHEGQEAVKWQ